MRSYVLLLPSHLLLPPISWLSCLLILLSPRSAAIPSHATFQLSLKLPWPIYDFQKFEFKITSWFTPSTPFLFFFLPTSIPNFRLIILATLPIKYHDLSISSFVSFFTPVRSVINDTCFTYLVSCRSTSYGCPVPWEWVAEKECLCLPAPSCSTLWAVEVAGGRGKMLLPWKQLATLTCGNLPLYKTGNSKKTGKKEEIRRALEVLSKQRSSIRKGGRDYGNYSNQKVTEIKKIDPARTERAGYVFLSLCFNLFLFQKSPC